MLVEALLSTALSASSQCFLSLFILRCFIWFCVRVTLQTKLSFSFDVKAVGIVCCIDCVTRHCRGFACQLKTLDRPGLVARLDLRSEAFFYSYTFGSVFTVRTAYSFGVTVSHCASYVIDVNMRYMFSCPLLF